MKEITFNKDQIIFCQGENASVMYDIISGKIGIFTDYQTEQEKKIAELDAGDSLMVIYLAEVDEAAAVPITNTATVTANTAAVEKESVIASASATVTPTAFADISIFKAADTDTVVSGDTLTYTFTLMNTGFDAAEDVVFTDAFPAEFGITGVSYTIDGVTTPVDPADYTVSGNTLTLPAETSALALGVAPATETGPGMTVITVTGTIA